MVTSRPARARDELQAHYTSSAEIVKYMVSKLRPAPGAVIWEPCAGGGDLIDGILQITSDVSIRASDISGEAVVALQDKYRDFPNVSVYQEDALDAGQVTLFDARLQFSQVLANPPYGAYLTPDRRTLLKKRYPKLYVRETYGLILYHALRLTRSGGRVVFIIPDTFLWLHRHAYLRKTLLTETTIEELALFPSKFFPGASFGYSGLCIITLDKTPPSGSHCIRIVEKLLGPSVLLECAASDYASGRCLVTEVSQQGIARRPHSELVRAITDDQRSSASARPTLTLGEVAEVRTGFYSGNDRRWLRRAHAIVPRSKHYQEVDLSLVSTRDSPSLNGIDAAQCFIPILRGGAASFIRPTLWYVDWAVGAVAEYRRFGKNPARFQNSQYYFKEGIGVPMVASTRLTASLLESRLFDQGIVGIFPKDDEHLLYLLGFLNTKLSTLLLREINPTANNSANYLKRLPVALPSTDELEECNRLVAMAIDECRGSEHVNQDTLEAMESLYLSIWRRPSLGDGCFPS